jgi:Bacterial Ig-like domain (group 3)
VTKVSGSATPTGTVTFKDGATTLGTGTLNGSSQASLILPSLSAGTHSITALYAGETKYAASTSVPVTVTVTPPPIVTSITPSSGSSAGGTSVTITGSNFTGATDVEFGSSPASVFTINSDSQTTAISPSGTSGMIVDVTITTPSGTSATSAADQFTYKTFAAKNMTTNAVTSLADALSAANPGEEIRTLAIQLDGNFILDRNVFLNGGYDAAYQIKSGTPTILNGTQTVAGGNSKSETLRVKGKLSIHGGTLRVKDVKVQQ